MPVIRSRKTDRRECPSGLHKAERLPAGSVRSGANRGSGHTADQRCATTRTATPSSPSNWAGLGLDRPEAPGRRGEVEPPDSHDLDFDQSDDDLQEFERRRKESLQPAAACAEGRPWAENGRRTLQPLLQDAEQRGRDNPLVIACADSMAMTAKIAAGHGMGYEEDVVRGNTVCCRRALEAARRSLAALAQLAENAILPGDAIQRLIAQGQQARRLVEQRIAELRAGAWWQ